MTSIARAMRAPARRRTAGTVSDTATEAVLRRGESVDQVVNGIRERILAGHYAVGQRLITRELMASLGYSRSTVREAFARLAAEGLVDLIPNRGAAVRGLSRKEILDLFQIRELLEGLSARLAAEAARRPKARATAREVLERLEKRPFSAVDFHAENLLVHETLMRLGGNAELEKLVARMHVPFVMMQARRTMGVAEIGRSQREHLAILRAVVAGKPDRAEETMRAHLRNTAQWLTSLPDATFHPGSADAPRDTVPGH